MTILFVATKISKHRKTRKSVMSLERISSRKTFQNQYKATQKAVERLSELLAIYEEQASLYETILEEIDSGDLPESFALERFDLAWQDRSEDHKERKKPDDLRKPIYRDRTLADIILSIFDGLDACQNPLVSIDELVQLIYSAKTKEDLNACKSSLTAVLNRCVNSDQLRRVRPGVFVRNPEKRLEKLYKEKELMMPYLSEKPRILEIRGQV